MGKPADRTNETSFFGRPGVACIPATGFFSKLFQHDQCCILDHFDRNGILHPLSCLLLYPTALFPKVRYVNCIGSVIDIYILFLFQRSAELSLTILCYQYLVRLVLRRLACRNAMAKNHRFKKNERCFNLWHHFLAFYRFKIFSTAPHHFARLPV